MLNRLLKLFISIIFYSLYKSYTYCSILLKKQIPGTAVILTYHSIKHNQRSVFEKHMDEVVKIGYPISVDKLSPLNFNKHHIAVTFDDGYQNVFYNALPAMRQRKIPAAIFITSGFLGKKPGWIYDTDHPNAKEPLLSVEQLQQLSNDLITIGSHTVSHPHLTTVEDNILFKEITDVKNTLEKLLKKNITMFSLPYGDYNQKVIKSLIKAGYKRIFLNIPTFPASKIENHLVGRIDVSLEDWLIEYRLKFLGAYQWLPIAVFIKRKIVHFIQK